jgi:hypothetical protein
MKSSCFSDNYSTIKYDIIQSLVLKGSFDYLEFDGTEFTYDKLRFPFVMLTANIAFHLVGHPATALVQEDWLAGHQVALDCLDRLDDVALPSEINSRRIVGTDKYYFTILLCKTA